MFQRYLAKVIHGGGLTFIPDGVMVEGREADLDGAFLPTPCLVGCLDRCVHEIIAEPGLYGVVFAGENGYGVRQYHGSFMRYSEFGMLGWVGDRLVSVHFYDGHVAVVGGQAFVLFSGRRGRSRVALPGAYSALMHVRHLGDEPPTVPTSVAFHYGTEVLLPMNRCDAYAPAA